MGKVKDLTPRKKQIIKTLLGESYTYRQVVDKCSSVYGFKASLCSISRISKEPLLVANSSRMGKCGRKRKLTKRDVRTLRRLARQNRRLPSRRLANLFREVTGISVCHDVVLRELYLSGMRRIKPKYKPLLTTRHKVARLKFSILHLPWHDEWEYTIFSDEKKFDVFSNDGGVRLWVDSSEMGTSAATLPSVKHSENPLSPRLSKCGSIKSTVRYWLI
jgi:hypothetical protein